MWVNKTILRCILTTQELYCTWLNTFRNFEWQKSYFPSCRFQVLKSRIVWITQNISKLSYDIRRPLIKCNWNNWMHIEAFSTTKKRFSCSCKFQIPNSRIPFGWPRASQNYLTISVDLPGDVMDIIGCILLIPRCSCSCRSRVPNSRTVSIIKNISKLSYNICWPARRCNGYNWIHIEASSTEKSF